METVLLHLTATVFDRGVKCVYVGFYVRECVGGSAFGEVVSEIEKNCARDWGRDEVRPSVPYSIPC